MDVEVNLGLKLSHGRSEIVLLFPDDPSILQSTDDGLQRAVYNLVHVAKDYNLQIFIT